MSSKYDDRVYDEVNAEIEREMLADMVAEYEHEQGQVLQLPKKDWMSDCCYEPIVCPTHDDTGFCTACGDNAAPIKSRIKTPVV